MPDSIFQLTVALEHLNNKIAMKKKIFTPTSLLCFMLVLALSTGCNAVSSKKEENKADSLKESIDGQQISAGEKWLRSIFQCQNENDYCFPDEEKVCTERYYEFFIESLEIYEYPDFESDAERIAAENAFKQKWEDIYPLGEVVLTPFGRGNGMETGQKLKNVAITSQSDGKYTVFIDYGDGIQTTSEVTLISSGNSFLVDFMKSDLVE